MTNSHGTLSHSSRASSSTARNGRISDTSLEPGGRDRSAVGLPRGRRRSVPHLGVGALLVLACAVGFAVIASRVDHRASVLALTRRVTVGQQLTSADLRTVRVSAEAGVAMIPATQLASVVGQPVAVSMPAGALLGPGDLGPAALPGGQAVVAVAVKAGQAPPGLAAGEHVLLTPVAATSAIGGSNTTPASGAPWTGVVTAVEVLGDEQDTTVISVQLAQAPAQAVAALPAGQIDLVQVSGS